MKRIEFIVKIKKSFERVNYAFFKIWGFFFRPEFLGISLLIMKICNEIKKILE